MVRYFRNPCDRDPPTRNFKNFKFFKNNLNSLKILSVYLWGTSVYFRGTGVYFWGTSVYFGDNRGFRGFWNFFFCCWGVLGLRGSGGPVGVSKISKKVIDGQNRQSPIASVQRMRSTLASHSAAPCGMNVKQMNANRAIRIAAQRTQGLWGLISLFSRGMWPPTNASDSNRSDNSR